MPNEAIEKLLPLLLVEQNIRWSVVKRPDVIRGDFHLMDRFPHAVACRPADVEEDGMRKNNCHDRMIPSFV